MRPIFALISVALAITTSTSSARIGDTFFQCKSRYGQPVSPGFAYYPLKSGKDGWALFNFKTVYVYVKCYGDKKVGRILYDTSRASMAYDPKDFLAINSGGSEWVQVAGKPYDFETKDGRLRAKDEDLRIEIWTVDSEKLEQSEKAARNAYLRKTALKGFGDDGEASAEITVPTRASQARATPSTETTVEQTPSSQAPLPQPSIRKGASNGQTGSEFKVLSATYGAEDVRKDVTLSVAGKISGNQLNFQAGNSELGGDPIFGKVKELHVKFVSNGQEAEKTFREGEQVSLP